MAITKKTFTVADTPVDAGWKKESASTHRKYPATKSQMTLFDSALFMMTSWLPGAGITHALGRTTQAEQTVTEAFHACEGLFSASNAEIFRSLGALPLLIPQSGPSEAFTRLAYRSLVTDRAMEACYHSSMA